MLAADIDTDQILPTPFLAAGSSDALVDGLFRYERDRDPLFPLNLPSFHGRSIILGGSNFGCGSSREAAVWALRAGGFEAVIATSFGDIFRGNAVKSGLIPVLLLSTEFGLLHGAFTQEASLEIVIDLDEALVRAETANLTFPLRIDGFTRRLLTEGMDELDYILEQADRIAEYEASDRMHPVTHARSQQLNGWTMARQP